jgi:hypothetical protein
VYGGLDLCLLIDREAVSDLSPLLSLKPKDLQALVFPPFSMSDDFAFYIQNLRGLGLLRLELTKFTKDEIYYLKDLRNLKWLYLFSENVSTHTLNALRRKLPDCVVSLASSQEAFPHDGLVSGDAPYTVEEMMEKVNQEGYRDDDGEPFTDVERFLLAVELSVARGPGGS